MTTSLETTPSRGHGGSRPVRLRLATRPGRDRLDGGWWPRSRDPLAELSVLLPHLLPLPGTGAQLVHATLAREDWDSTEDGTVAREVTVDGRTVRLGWTDEERHLVVLSFSDGSDLGLLVVPPDFTRGQGAEALLASATAGNDHSAADLLDEVTDQPDVDPDDHWADDGGA